MLILCSSVNFVAQDFLQHLPKKPTALRLTFVQTAAEVETGNLSWLKADRQALLDAGFPVTDFTFHGQNEASLREMLDQTDLLFLSGGNTLYLLQEIQKSGLDKIIKEYLDRGLIYAGSSAGSIVAGPSIEMTPHLDDLSKAPDIQGFKGLNLTDVVVFPHWGSPHFHGRYERLMKAGYKKGLKIVLLTDDQYLLVEGEKYQIHSI